MKGNRYRPPIGLRVDDVVKEAIRIAAFKNRRSMNSEIALRVEESLRKSGYIEEAIESLKNSNLIGGAA